MLLAYQRAFIKAIEHNIWILIRRLASLGETIFGLIVSFATDQGGGKAGIFSRLWDKLTRLLPSESRVPGPDTIQASIWTGKLGAARGGGIGGGGGNENVGVIAPSSSGVLDRVTQVAVVILTCALDNGDRKVVHEISNV
jgi:hypothetical protein